MLGPSVTSQGRQLISASIVAFEGLLGDNISFYDPDEVTNFLDNILQETYDEEEILEPVIQITPELVKSRIKSKCEFELTTGFNSYLDQVVSSVPLTVLQKIYYKNNFYEFIEIPDIKEAISENLIRDDFFDPNKPPEDIADILRAIYETVHYFVAYPYPYNRKTHRVSTMYRKTVLVCDTDSNFILVYPWLEFVCKTKGLVIDELTTEERVSIISSITYIFSEFIKETFAIFNTNSNVPETEFHRIDMKSELILYVAHYKLY